MSSVLRALSGNLSTAETELRDQHIRIQTLRDELRHLRSETSSVFRETSVSILQNKSIINNNINNNNNISSGGGGGGCTISWPRLHQAMQIKVHGFGQNSNNQNLKISTHSVDDDDDVLLTSPDNIIDSTLTITHELTSWCISTLLPQLQLWRRQLDDFGRRLRKIDYETKNPRVISFCSDLRRRARVAALLGNSSPPQQRSTQSRVLETEYSNQAAKRNSHSNARRKELSELNVRLAQAVALSAQQP